MGSPVLRSRILSRCCPIISLWVRVAKWECALRLPQTEEQSLPHENLWLESRPVRAVGLSWGKDCLSPWILLYLVEKDSTCSPTPSPRNCTVGAPLQASLTSQFYICLLSCPFTRLPEFILWISRALSPSFRTDFILSHTDSSFSFYYYNRSYTPKLLPDPTHLPIHTTSF